MGFHFRYILWTDYVRLGDLFLLKIGYVTWNYENQGVCVCVCVQFP